LSSGVIYFHMRLSPDNQLRTTHPPPLIYNFYTSCISYLSKHTHSHHHLEFVKEVESQSAELETNVKSFMLASNSTDLGILIVQDKFFAYLLPCDGTSLSKWVMMENGTVVNVGNKLCLSAKGNNPYITMEICGSGEVENQKWRREGNLLTKNGECIVAVKTF